jgi:hypothetical protein
VNSLEHLVGKRVTDCRGQLIGEIESVSDGKIIVVRGVTKIQRTTIPFTDIVSDKEDSLKVSKKSDDYTWKDMGVRCENCGLYSQRPIVNFGHYFCSNNCKDQLKAKFSKYSYSEKVKGFDRS